MPLFQVTTSEEVFKTFIMSARSEQEVHRFVSEDIGEGQRRYIETERTSYRVCSVRKIGEDDVSSDEKEQMEIEFESIEMVSVVS